MKPQITPPAPEVLSAVPYSLLHLPRCAVALIVAFAAALFTNLALAALPSYVQGHYEYSPEPRARMQVNFKSAQQAGDLNIVIVGQRDTIGRVHSVRDTMGNQYKDSGEGIVTSNFFAQTIFYALNILPAAAVANTLTVNFDRYTTAPDVRVLEYSGILASATPLFALGFGSGDWCRGGNVILSTVPSLLISANMAAAGITTTGPTGGFTQRLLTPNGDSAEDRVVTALSPPNSYNAGARLSSIGLWLMETLVFRGSDAPSPAASASVPAFVQGNSVATQAVLPSVIAPFKEAQAAGDLNVVIVDQEWNESTAEGNPPTDVQGNEYKLAAAPTMLEGPVSLAQSVYYAKNIAAAPAGANVVTMKFSGGAAVNPEIRVLEYSGLDPVHPLEGAATGTGNGALSQSGPLTTTNARDLLIGANFSLARVSSPGEGFTQRLIPSSGGVIAQDSTVAETGTYNSRSSLESPGPWIMQLVAFRAAGSPETPAP